MLVPATAAAEDVPPVAAAVIVEPAVLAAVATAVLVALPPYGAGAGTGTPLAVLFASWTKFAHVSLVVFML